MKKRLMILHILLISLVFLAACNRTSQYPKGVVFVAPLGKPPIDFIIWSPVSNSEILVNANYIQPGPAKVFLLDILTGAERTLLETKQGHLWSQNWLPSGSEVIIAVSPGTVGFEDGGIWKIDVRDNSIEPVDESFVSVWSPDGSRRAYESREQGMNAPQRDIYVITSSSNEEEILYSEPDGGEIGGLSWSPDGKELVFSVRYSASSALKVLNLQSGMVRELRNTGYIKLPRWAPTGDVIAYQASDDGIKYTIHFIRPDGSCEFEFEGINDAHSLTWSPDGRKLAFVGGRGMYYLDIDEVFKDRLTPQNCP